MAAKWKRSKDMEWEQLGSEALVVSPKSGKSWALNAMGASIWSLCDGSLDSCGIAAALARAGGQSRRAIRQEIERFCAALSLAGLLQPAQGASPAMAMAFTGLPAGAPGFRPMGAGGHGRRRPSPNGVSGPG